MNRYDDVRGIYSIQSIHDLRFTIHALSVGVGIEPTSRVFQTRANPSQLSDPLTFLIFDF